MNPFIASQFCTPSLSSAPSPAPPTSPQSPHPFHFVSFPCHDRGLRPPGVQTPLSPPDSTPRIHMQREAPLQASYQGPGSYTPCLANGPLTDHQTQESLILYSQQPTRFRNEQGAGVKEKRPPRPSNAFLLFRSDFLKRKLVPKDQEARQQKLSIIAAKCWHKLSPEEKNKWYLEAEREKKEHANRYAKQLRARERTRTRRSPRVTRSPGELAHLGHLADMAYQGIVNDVPSQLEQEKKLAPPPTTATPSLASKAPMLSPGFNEMELFTFGDYPELQQPFQQPPLSFPTGDVGLLSFPPNFQSPQSAGGFTGSQDVHMFPGVSHFTQLSTRCTFSDGVVICQAGVVGAYTVPVPASAGTCPPTAGSSFSGTTSQMLTAFPSQFWPQGSTAVQGQYSNYYAMSSGSPY